MCRLLGLIYYIVCQNFANQVFMETTERNFLNYNCGLRLS